MSTESLNTFFAAGIIVMQAGVIFGIILLIGEYFGKFHIPLLIKKASLPLALVIVLGATAISFYYSEVVGFVPCGLCWLQRVFLFPQVFLLGIALLTKDCHIWKYSITLSGVGAGIALYQHFLQMGVTGFLPCPAAGVGADCAKRIIFEFGYITFPLISFTVFIFLIMLMLFYRNKVRHIEN